MWLSITCVISVWLCTDRSVLFCPSTAIFSNIQTDNHCVTHILSSIAIKPKTKWLEFSARVRAILDSIDGRIKPKVQNWYTRCYTDKHTAAMSMIKGLVVGCHENMCRLIAMSAYGFLDKWNRTIYKANPVCCFRRKHALSLVCTMIYPRKCLYKMVTGGWPWLYGS
jgi:hypothetical protein